MRTRLSFLLPLSLLACQGEARIDLSTREGALGHSEQAATALPEVAYFRAALAGPCTQSGCSYVATPLNGAVAGCGDAGATKACEVAAIDLTSASMSREEAGALLAGLGAATEGFRTVLVGSIVTGAEARRTLRVFEVWTAEEAAPSTASVHFVTRATTPCFAQAGCATVDAIRVNQGASRWSSVRAADFRLTSAKPVRMPFSGYERACTEQNASRSLTTATVPDLGLDAAAGILVAGTVSAQRVEASTYFVRAMPNVACDHRHPENPIDCCGLGNLCWWRERKLGAVSLPEWDRDAPEIGATVVDRRDLPQDHILGGIACVAFQYARAPELAGWLTQTGQPASQGHGHAMPAESPPAPAPTTPPGPKGPPKHTGPVED